VVVVVVGVIGVDGVVGLTVVPSSQPPLRVLLLYDVLDNAIVDGP